MLTKRLTMTSNKLRKFEAGELNVKKKGLEK